MLSFRLSPQALMYATAYQGLLKHAALAGPAAHAGSQVRHFHFVFHPPPSLLLHLDVMCLFTV